MNPVDYTITTFQSAGRASRAGNVGRALMMNNFRVDVVYHDISVLYLRILGSFDGAAAYKLLRIIAQHAPKVQKISINTDGLDHVNPYGFEIFRSKIEKFSARPAQITFSGKAREALALM